MTKGKIIRIEDDGTAVITAPVNIAKFIREKPTECYVDFIDSRPLSDKQRKMCYALIHAIADWSGSSSEEIKEAFKLEFWASEVERLGDKVFSLSNAPMSLVKDFQRFLIEFIINNGVPVKQPLREYADDIDHYVYMCLINKKCAVCGKHAELHHIDVIGMGNDRQEVGHEGREAMSLCREHHSELHTIGKHAFFEKYHFENGVEIDRTIMKIYGLKK